MIDRRIHECATEIDALPVKPPYDEFLTMVKYVLMKYMPTMDRVNSVRSDWTKRPDCHLGGAECMTPSRLEEESE